MLTPRQLALLMSAAGALSISIALGWAVQGVWAVMPFALIETAGLAAAFVFYSRHAADLDRVVIGQDRVEVEVIDGPKITRTSCATTQARVRYDKAGSDLVGVGELGRFARVGRFVPAEDRQRLAQEIASALGIRAIAQ